MTRLLLALTCLFSTTAHAADRALVLTDEEQSALVNVLDAATKAQGLSVAQTTLYFLNKIRSAPTVVPHVDAPKPATEEPHE